MALTGESTLSPGSTCITQSEGDTVVDTTHKTPYRTLKEVSLKVVGAFLLVGLLSGGIVIGGPPIEREPAQVVEVGGGTAQYSPLLTTGERFLQPVELPPHLAPGAYEPAEGEKEQPGDGKDDELLVTKRRHTVREADDLPLTGGLWLEGVHGTAENPICICDATFVLWNKTEGRDPTRPVKIRESSHILVDNITIYNGDLLIQWSDNITVSRSQFLGAIISDYSWDIHVIDNDFWQQAGPLDFYDVPPLYSECWPSESPTCGFTGINVRGGRWLIEHNYFDGDGGVGGVGNTRDVRIIHNSFYNGGGMLVGDGDTEVSWNLLRGWGGSGAHIAGSTYARITNNSFVLTTEIDLGDRVFGQTDAIFLPATEFAEIRDNDFIGYGIGAQGRVMATALWVESSTARADSNYWGTLHDPRIPPGTWIHNSPKRPGVIHLDNWDLEPNHDVSLAVAVNEQDWPYWYSEISGQPWPAPVTPEEVTGGLPV